MSDLSPPLATAALPDYLASLNTAQREAALHGCGPIADADPLLERIDLIPGLPSLPVWLTAPPRLRQSPRLRRVWDALAAAFPA